MVSRCRGHYVALLCAVNVGGTGTPAMSDLAQSLLPRGYLPGRRRSDHGPLSASDIDRSEELTASELHVKQRDMSVLFLCIGNHYGSRFADELFNHRTAHSGADWQAQTRFALAEAVYAVDQVRTPSISWQ
jgi:hypothetical protein